MSLLLNSEADEKGALLKAGCALLASLKAGQVSSGMSAAR